MKKKVIDMAKWEEKIFKRIYKVGYAAGHLDGYKKGFKRAEEIALNILRKTGAV
jgi:hypothetical protein